MNSLRDCSRWSKSPHLQFFVIFFVCSLIGQYENSLRISTVLWPATAILLTAFIQSKSRNWLAYLALSLLANWTSQSLLMNQPFVGTQLSWLSMAIQCLLGASLIKGIYGENENFSFNSLSRVLTFACAGVIAPAAIGALLAAWAESPEFDANYWLAWHEWWSSSSLNCLTLIPLIVAFQTRSTLRSSRPRLQLLEQLLGVIGLISLSFLWFSTGSPLLVFSLFLLLLWIAIKYEFHGIATANFVLITLALINSHHVSNVLLTQYSITQTMLYLNLSLGLFCIATLAVSSALIEKRIAQAETKTNLLRYNYLIENTSDFMVILDPQFHLICGNNAWKRAMGYDEKSLSSMTIRDLVHPSDRSHWDRAIQDLLNQVHFGQFEVRMITRHGKTISLEASFDQRQEDGQTIEIHSILRDISERKIIDQKNSDYQKQLEAANSKLRSLSITDGLTQVYNRRFFQQRMEEEFARCQRYHSPMAILLIDVDHFKKFNDTYGHQAGDRVLCKVASKLTQSVRTNDIVARYGGEEFAALLPITDLKQAEISAERVRNAILEVCWYGEKVTVSIGVAALSDLTGSVEDLIHQADQALYSSKQAGRNRVTLYDPLSQKTLVSQSHFDVENLSKL